MGQAVHKVLIVCLVLAVSTLAKPAFAETFRIKPGELGVALNSAKPGDKLILTSGVYRGNFVVSKTLSLMGENGSVLDAGGKGRVLVLDAPHISVSGVVVQNSGQSLADEDTGIFLTDKARNAIVQETTLKNNLIGVYLKGSQGALVKDNRIIGLQDLRVNERGNGVHIWNAPGAEIIGNQISHGRDGIFVTTSRHNRFHGNVFSDLRFAVHYMYTQDSEVSENRSYGNDVGYALMYSRRLHVRDNLSEGDRDHGLLLNYVLSSDIRGNAVTDGGEKCTFLYNTNKTRFTDNWFEGCEIGIHFTAGSERNVIAGNAFINNRTQVKYVGTRHQSWSDAGRGNYWSDYANFDLNGDGIGDRSYRPNDMVDQILWAHPQAKFLLKSPALSTLRYVQSQLPALYPGGVVDPAPLMQPPPVSAMDKKEKVQ